MFYFAKFHVFWQFSVLDYDIVTSDFIVALLIYGQNKNIAFNFQNLF